MKIKCPGCDFELEEDDLWGQVLHIIASHPDIANERSEEAHRWDGWEDR